MVLKCKARGVCTFHIGLLQNCKHRQLEMFSAEDIFSIFLEPSKISRGLKLKVRNKKSKVKTPIIYMPPSLSDLAGRRFRYVSVHYEIGVFFFR